MANPTQLPGDLIVPGDVTITDDISIGGQITPLLDRDEVLAVTELATFTVPMSIWREHDDYATPLDGTPVADAHLGLVGGTFNTNAPSLQTDDFGGNGAVAAENFYARGEIVLPWNYVAGQTVKIRVHGGMLTTVADTTATVDLQVYKSDEDSTSTGDLCATAATTINSLVFADKDFTITATTLNPGDVLDVLIDVNVEDTTDAGAMTAVVGSVQLLCDVR